MNTFERTCPLDGMILNALGGGVIGNTTGSGPVIEGSSPSPRAWVGYYPALLAPSSSGLGRRPLKPVTPVRIRSGLPLLGVAIRSRNSGLLASCRHRSDPCSEPSHQVPMNLRRDRLRGRKAFSHAGEP